MCLREEVFTTLEVQCPNLVRRHRLKLKVDTGASGNTLALRTIQQMYGKEHWRSFVTPASVKLTAYNGTDIMCLGTIDLLCRYRELQWSKHRFYVVDVPGPAIAGFPACEELKMVTINSVETPLHPDMVEQKPQVQIKSIQDLVQAYPEQFDTIGSFEEEASIHLKEGAKPSIDAPRKCSIHLKDKLRNELEKMERQGVIRKVTHHTDWCSSLVTSVKKDGSLRLCLDPKRLNQSLKRCPHKIPTLEELNPAFAKAKFFSKLDAKAGYWSVHLSRESQELTTFRTVFGRFCFRRCRLACQ